MEYVVWRAHPPAGYCMLEYLENVDDEYELKRAISRKKDFPAEARFSMKRSSPKAKKLADNVANLDGLTVVSKRLMEFLKAKKPPKTEFLQVTIMDHKGGVASADYYVVNPCQLIDCIDQEATKKLSWNKIDKELISGCFGLVLKEDTIDPKYTIFRPKYMPTAILITKELADEMKSEGFVGMSFFDLDEFVL